MSRDTSPLRTIASLRDGETVRIVGAVRSASEQLLDSPTHQRCVYWDQREGLDDPPHAHETIAFWVEDASGRVLIAGDPLDVDARSERRRTLLAAVEADLATLAARLRELKAIRKRGADDVTETDRERARVAEAVTLLCAMRAHARGRLHFRGMSLSAQEQWIKKRSDAFSRGATERSVTLFTERWETTITEGQTIEAMGVVSVEPAPANIAQGTNYRAMTTVMVLRGVDASGVQITGLGSAAPLSERERRALKKTAMRNERRPAPDSMKGTGERFGLGFLVTAAVVGAVAALLRALGKM